MLDVYQARNGKIYIRNGTAHTPLTKKQIHDLMLVVFELEDFDFDAYKAAYANDEAPPNNGMKPTWVHAAYPDR